jgi:enoyl-CoA hydratase
MSTVHEENCVLVTRGERIWTIVINRPESLNALNADVLQSLLNELQVIARTPSVSAVVITGRGPKAFVAGADIRSMQGLGSRPIADYVELGQRTMRAIETCRVPVIAAINGFALGGGLELALSCDVIVCAESAKLGQPEVNLGIIPGFGGTQRLIQRCGVGQARRLCYTGDLISASEALTIGLTEKVVPDAELMDHVSKMAETIASKAPLAVQGAKRVVNAAQDNTLLSGLRLEVEEFLRLFGTADREEGMSAFIEKRKALFTGR